MEIRKYMEKDISAMVYIWNKVVEDGEAFPQEDFLNDKTGADFFAAQTYCGVADDNGKIVGLYTPELTDEIQPMVKIRFSQDSNIKEGSIDILEEGIKEVSSGKESESVMQAKPAKEKTIDKASKKSIHARLQEKKNELAKKPGKDNPQRGVELA